jgi:hypothetical protein
MHHSSLMIRARVREGRTCALSGNDDQPGDCWLRRLRLRPLDMESGRLVGFVVIALVSGGASRVAAQCRPADDDGAYIVAMVADYAYPRDASWAAARDSLRIGVPPAQLEVVQITTPELCEMANRAYRTAATGDCATLSGRVYVVRSGETYVVWDPSYRYTTGSSDTYMVFDANWKFLRGFQ